MCFRKYGTYDFHGFLTNWLPWMLLLLLLLLLLLMLVQLLLLLLLLTGARSGQRETNSSPFFLVSQTTASKQTMVVFIHNVYAAGKSSGLRATNHNLPLPNIFVCTTMNEFWNDF